MKSHCSAIALLTLTGIIIAQASPPEAPKRIPTPDAALLKNALKLVDDIYKDDLAKARTPEQKLSLAKAMLATAGAEKDSASRFALLTTASELASTAADLETAAAALHEIDAIYQVDALKLRSDAAWACARATHTPDQSKKFRPLAGEIVEAAVAADRYDLARSVGDAMLFAAHAANDPASTKDALAKIQEIHEAESAYTAVKAAIATLNARPDDPDANLAVGKYRCFIKGDWDGGLPMLALSGDDVIEPLAKTDRAGVKTAEDQVKLADGWWNQSDKAAGLAQRQLRAHAAKWYQAALPNLAGLTKLRVQKRLETLEPVAAAPAGKPVDLLALVDPKKDLVAGAWQLQNNTLKSDDGAGTRIELPYHPAAEYDLHIEFAREQGDDSVNIILAAAGKHFMWTMGGWSNTILGFDEINHVRANKNPKSVSVKTVLENARKYDVIIKIRKTGIEAYVNGKLASEWKTDYADMGIPENWNIRDPAALGLATNKSVTTFYKLEITDIGGAGAPTRK